MSHPFRKYDDECPGLPSAFERLQQVEGCRLVQGRAGLEAITGGIMPNKYTLGDMGVTHDTKDEDGNVVHSSPMPMFIVEEEMDGCCTGDFCCRVCCSPNHPTILKMW